MEAYYTDQLLYKTAAKPAQSYAFTDFVRLVNTASGAYNKGGKEDVR